MKDEEQIDDELLDEDEDEDEEKVGTGFSVLADEIAESTPDDYFCIGMFVDEKPPEGFPEEYPSHTPIYGFKGSEYFVKVWKASNEQPILYFEYMIAELATAIREVDEDDWHNEFRHNSEAYMFEIK